MKKFLSVVLALVMTMSLVTITAGAKDFTDNSKITYGEAVGVISGIGVVDGYTDGSFNPSATLTRGAAAKIICNMLLGPTAANALGVSSAPFKDVPVSNVFSGYIAYCAQQGIINGYADGTFKPSGTVTGYQFLKMLLGALGYDSTVEGFTGANWSVAVAKLAISNKLTKGNDAFVGSQALTREAACLYAFNTLMATLVEYDTKGTTINVGGTTISTGSSKATAVAETGYTNTMHTDNLQFAEKYFSKLTKDTDVYAEGRTGRSFSYKGTEISSFGSTDDVLATATNGKALSDLTTSSNSDYIGYKAGNSVTYLYNDGVSTQATVATAAAKKGVVVYFLDTDSDGKYDVISAVQKTVAKLSAAPKTTTSGAVTKVTISGIVSSKESDKVVYPSDLAKDDVVLYYNSNNGKTYVEKAKTVVGTMTSNSSSKITVDGTAYAVTDLTGNNFGASATTLANSVAVKSGTTYYLDNNGGVCYYVLGDDAVSLDNTLFVRDATNSGYVYSAKIVYTDGTTGTINVNKTANYGGTLKEVTGFGTGSMADGYLKTNAFYTFVKNTDGTYNLTSCQYQTSSNGIDTNVNTLLVAKGTATLAGKYATSTTAYVLEKGSVSVTPTFTAGTSYTAYTGVSNTAGYKDGVASDGTTPTAYVLYNSDNYIVAVVARNGVLDTTSTADYTVVMPVSGPSTVYKTDGSVDYYTYKAVVNGDVVEAYKVASTSLLTLGTPVLVNGFDGDKANSVEGSVVNMQPTTPKTGTEIAVSNGTLFVKDHSGNFVANSAFALASDAQVFVYDVSDKSVETASASNMTAEDGHYYTVSTVATSNSNSAVKYVFINDYTAATTPATYDLTSPISMVKSTGSATLNITPATATGWTVTSVTAASSVVTVGGTLAAATITAGASAGSTTVSVLLTNSATGATHTDAFTVTVTD